MEINGTLKIARKISSPPRGEDEGEGEKDSYPPSPLQGRGRNRLIVSKKSRRKNIDAS
jgi:hypothetical protein